ncbi:MAG: SAM-dependent methyltransferase, partial [Leptolyngbyaceae cyanobacterium SM2_5_2]|nr:SAM-dependent methyltransferase [Leptolyngbyaceae cyanobacterium SM2_5_2]
IFDHNYQFVTLSALEFEVLQACDRAKSANGPQIQESALTVADLLRQTSVSLHDIRQMHRNQLILLQPSRLSP